MPSIGDARLAAIRVADGPEVMRVAPPAKLPALWSEHADARDRWRSLVPALLRCDPTSAVVGLCATAPGEGTSTLAAGLACACAEAHLKTVVLEASVAGSRRGSVWDDGVAAQGRDRQLLDSIELVGVDDEADGQMPNRLKRQLLEVRGRGRIVLADLQPLKTSAQVFSLAGALDAVYLVVEAERERREVISKSVESLTRAGLHVAGVLLNKRTRPIPNFLYRWL